MTWNIFYTEQQPNPLMNLMIQEQQTELWPLILANADRQKQNLMLHYEANLRHLRYKRPHQS